MINQVLLFIPAALLIVWGIAHLFPTRSVANGFGDITNDNRRIIIMEWINEGIALIFIGIVILGLSLIDYKSKPSIFVFWTIFFALNAFSIISLFTGFRIRFIPFKLCPVIFTLSSVLMILGMYL